MSACIPLIRCVCPSVRPTVGGGAMVLGILPVPGRPTNLIILGQGPTALAVGAGGSCLDIFSLAYHFSFLSPSLWRKKREMISERKNVNLSPFLQNFYVTRV